MIRHDGSKDQEVWDITNPTAPYLITQIQTGLDATHHCWWECDTGIAYLISRSAGDSWHTPQHVYIYDMSNPHNPVLIRQWGLISQQPSANLASA
jgi:hypothetical protein